MLPTKHFSFPTLVNGLTNCVGMPQMPPIEMDFLPLLMTSLITSGLLFPLPVSWPIPTFTVLSLVTPFSLHCLDPTLDRIECAYFYNCISKGWQYNGALKWAIIANLYLAAAGTPLVSENSFLMALTWTFIMWEDILNKHMINNTQHICQMHNTNHAEDEQQVMGACGKPYLVWRSRKGIQIKGRGEKTCSSHCFYCTWVDALGSHKTQQRSHTL